MTPLFGTQGTELLIRYPSPSTRAPTRPGVRDRARPWWSVYFARDAATIGQTPFSAGVGRIGANHPCLCAVVWFELLSAWLVMYFGKKKQSRADGACVCRCINSQTSNRFRFDQIQLRVQQKGNPFLDLLMGGSSAGIRIDMQDLNGTVCDIWKLILRDDE
jgi:hypothetical protein